MSPIFVILIAICIAVDAQRSPFAGSRGNGYKDRFVSDNDAIGTRFGETPRSRTIGSTRTRLPHDAYGDEYIVNYYNSVPVDRRPYWLLNQQQIEAQRGTPSRSNSRSMINNRFGESFNNEIDSISQQEVVYPSNVTPEQRLDMEIHFLQNKLDATIGRRHQLQAQRRH